MLTNADVCSIFVFLSLARPMKESFAAWRDFALYPDSGANTAGAHFTCFTGSKVQILTLLLLLLLAEGRLAYLKRRNARALRHQALSH